MDTKKFFLAIIAMSSTLPLFAPVIPASPTGQISCANACDSIFNANSLVPSQMTAHAGIARTHAILQHLCPSPTSSQAQKAAASSSATALVPRLLRRPSFDESHDESRRQTPRLVRAYSTCALDENECPRALKSPSRSLMRAILARAEESPAESIAHDAQGIVQAQSITRADQAAQG